MAKRTASKKIIRVGVFGVSRGEVFASGSSASVGMKLVALCDAWEERLRLAGARHKVATYTDFDKFLEHDMDAVILANYFHQHAPFAVKALRAGKHVMSETTACFTLAEGVELIEAAEKSDGIYMFAENYPYSAVNQEMRRLYQSGFVGKFLYGEGEYVHPIPAGGMNSLSPGVNHWRNWIPATYYSTHALAPIMVITGTRPVKVNGFIIPYDFDDEKRRMTALRNDNASMIALRMDNGAVVKLLQYGLRGHGNFVRIHGNKGLMELGRGTLSNMLRIRREPEDKKRGEPVERLYVPDFPVHHDRALRAGHEGGDFFMNYHFTQAIHTGEPPYIDVYRGVAMSIVGSLAYRSALDDSNTVDVPDFRKKSLRDKYRNDHWNPDPARHKKGYPLPSILGDIKPTAKGLAYARSIWDKMGYKGI